MFLTDPAAGVIGPAYALRPLPVGTGNAVWAGIGAVLTVTYAMLSGAGSVTALKLLVLRASWAASSD
ncbi:hypothetical protein [Streptomyces sp. NPDC057340]|uniref:hypothetical protein n=1 Tax=Streptomyces sp. NPDC057340 TaxID=3346103 RepID=UPI003641C463